MGFNRICFYFAAMLLLTIMFIAFMILNWKKFNLELNQNAMEIKNEVYKLYMQMNPEEIEKSLDELVERYLNKYIVTNIMANQITYINREEVNEMIKVLDKTITLELSELYLFYIKCLVNIRTEDDLLKFVHNKVKDHVLAFVTEFNKTK